MKITPFVGISNNVKTIIKMGTIAIALAYFCFHAISGDNGLISYLRTKKSVTQQEEILKKVTNDLESLKKNVDLLSDKSLDKDLLEERCRVILNYSLPEDTIIKTKSVVY